MRPPTLLLATAIFALGLAAQPPATSFGQAADPATEAVLPAQDPPPDIPPPIAAPGALGEGPEREPPAGNVEAEPAGPPIAVEPSVPIVPEAPPPEAPPADAGPSETQPGDGSVVSLPGPEGPGPERAPEMPTRATAAPKSTGSGPERAPDAIMSVPGTEPPQTGVPVPDSGGLPVDSDPGAVGSGPERESISPAMVIAPDPAVDIVPSAPLPDPQSSRASAPAAVSAPANVSPGSSAMPAVTADPPVGGAPSESRVRVVAVGPLAPMPVEVAWRTVRYVTDTPAGATARQWPPGFIVATEGTVVIVDETAGQTALVPGQVAFVPHDAVQQRVGLADEPAEYLALELVPAANPPDPPNGTVLHAFRPFGLPPEPQQLSVVRHTLMPGERVAVPETGERNVLIVLEGVVTVNSVEIAGPVTLKAEESAAFTNTLEVAIAETPQDTPAGGAGATIVVGLIGPNAASPAFPAAASAARG